MVPCRIRVLYGDTDQMGVVYYANYLRWFEAGRNALCREREVPYGELEAAGFALPVVEAQASYRRPARYDDLVRIETEVAVAGRTRLRFDYRIFREGDETLLCTGHTVHALVGRDGRPVRLPPDVVSRLGAA
jgi:acyl-CoA thioester hydrolase